MFEAAGLSTVTIVPIRAVAERMHPPRALHVEFPLGRPLGKPRDARFQHRVLDAAFALLAEPAGPVLVDFPETIATQEDAEPLVCPLPPRHDPDLHPAIDEAQALRNAYDRAVAQNGRTSVGMAVRADDIPEAIGKFVRIAQGEAWDKVGLGEFPGKVGHDIRTYYEELAGAVADGPIEPWATERWFYDRTETGQVLLAARRTLRETGAPLLAWFLLAPASRE